jgi:uncharacterized membrane protein
MMGRADKKGHKRKSEKGSAAIYWAAAMFFIVPLMALSIDMPRALYVRSHLQAATDAACEAAAMAVDVPVFRETGVAKIKYDEARVWAAREFVATVADQGIWGYSPALTSVVLETPLIASCTASASVNPLIPISPAMNIVVRSTSETRVGKR